MNNTIRQIKEKVNQNNVTVAIEYFNLVNERYNEGLNREHEMKMFIRELQRYKEVINMKKGIRMKWNETKEEVEKEYKKNPVYENIVNTRIGNEESGYKYFRIND